MTTNGDTQFAPGHVTVARHSPSRSRWAAAQEAGLEFGRFRVLLRRRQLIADGAPVKLGTRALDLLLVLLEAEGSLVTKGELLARVWPGIHVSDENLKLQVSALRKAFGEDRDFIRTEFGRGYRFTAAVKSTSLWQRSTKRLGGDGHTKQWRGDGSTGDPFRRAPIQAPTCQPCADRDCAKFAAILKTQGIDELITALNRKASILTGTTASSF